MKAVKYGIEPLEPARKDRPIRVIVVGDGDRHAQVAEALAGSEVAFVDHAATGDMLVDRVAQEEFDCIIADQTIGGLSSLELRLQIEQRMPAAPALILLTADGSPATMLRAFRKGISDFIHTGHQWRKQLLQAVRHAAEQNRKRQNLIDEIEHLSRLARYDRLTGVANRNFLDERLNGMIASAGRHGSKFSIFLIDINNFKAINDIYGHAIADQALKAFARRLMQTARSSDAFGRFGGDEFLYLIDREVTFENAEAVCARLASALAFSIELESIRVSLSASIGAAIFPHDGRNVEELMNSADQAMYIAKASGGGYHIARPPSASTEVLVAVEPSAAAEPVAALTQPKQKRAVGPGKRDENRRVEHRDRVFRRGRIVLGDGFSTIDCIIRDISPRGARITVDDHITIPRSITFAVLDTGQIFPAIRRWQRGPSFGIEFEIEAVETGKPSEDAA